MEAPLFCILGGEKVKFSNTDRHDPYKNFNFSVDFVGKTRMIKSGFMSVSPIMAKLRMKEYKEGGDNTTPHKIPEKVGYEPVELTRGMSEDNSFFEAFNRQFSEEGIGVLKENQFVVKIKVRDRDGDVLKEHQLINAFITDLEIGELNAMTSNILLEKIVLQFEEVVMDS